MIIKKTLEICVWKFFVKDLDKCGNCDGTKNYYGDVCPHYTEKPKHEIEDALDYKDMNNKERQGL